MWIKKLVTCYSGNIHLAVPKGSTALGEPGEPSAEQDVEDEEWQFEEEKDLEQKLQDMEAQAKLAEEAAAEAEKAVEGLMQALEETEDFRRLRRKKGGRVPWQMPLTRLRAFRRLKRPKGGRFPLKTEREEPEVVVFRFAVPMSSKSASLVLEVVNSWWQQQGGLRRRPQPEIRSPMAVESTIQEMKSRMGPSYWPLACRYVCDERRRRRRCLSGETEDSWKDSHEASEED